MDQDTPDTPDGAGELRLRCACGWETRGTREQLITDAVEHGRRLHNMEPTPEQVLAMITRD
jgi:predicted small metal-binding protein